MNILRRSKNSFVMLRLLLAFHLISTSLAIFSGRIFLRLLCFHHPSSSLQSNVRCDRTSPCDPEFIFCFYNSTNYDTCNIRQLRFNFSDSLRLGVCLDDRAAKNVPDPLEFAMTTTMPQLSLRLSINQLDRRGLFVRRSAIDDLSFRLLPASLATLPFGQTPVPEDYTKVPITSRTFLGPGRPLVELAAVVQCAPGRFGPLCEVQCKATDQFGCFNNGSRQCRPGWMGTNCSERDFCAEQPCKPWAICRNIAGSFQCSCDGATGPQCLRGGDPCLNHRCANNATCLGVSERPVCVCRHGWAGRFCRDIDPCVPDPCSGNGRCFAEGSAHRCTCRNGFFGPACNGTAATQGPGEERRGGVPKRPRRPSTALLLLLIILAVLILAVAAIAIRCFWQHRRGNKANELHYPSLSTLSHRTSTPTSTSIYDESHLTTEVRLSAEEGVYEIPGQLYSVKEEEEDEVGEHTAFQPATPERPRLLSEGSRCVRFVRA